MSPLQEGDGQERPLGAEGGTVPTNVRAVGEVRGVQVSLHGRSSRARRQDPYSLSRMGSRDTRQGFKRRTVRISGQSDEVLPQRRAVRGDGGGARGAFCQPTCAIRGVCLSTDLPTSKPPGIATP